MRKRSDDRQRHEFIRRVRLAMDQSGISQNELARRTGQSSQGVSDWFAKGALPGGEALIRLPDALGVSGHWLITGEGSMVPAGDGGMERAFGMGALAALADVRAAVEDVSGRWTKPGATSRAGGALARIGETDVASGTGRRRRPGA